MGHADKRRAWVLMIDLLCITPNYDANLVSALSKLGIQTRLASISFHLDLEYYDRAGVKPVSGIIDVVARLHIKHRALRRSLKWLEYILNLCILSMRIIFVRPAVVHIQWLPLLESTSLELGFIKFLKALHIPVVYTVHNILPHDTGKTHFAKFSKVYSRADALICHTTDSKTMLTEGFGTPSANIRCITFGPNIAYENLDRIQVRKELDISPNQVVVLACGTIRPYKGLEFFIQSWNHLMKRHDLSNALLIIAGQGPDTYQRKIGKLVEELDSKERVRTIFGYLPDHEVVKLHSASDILVYPYSNITQSGAILTGMSFGKAVIASDLAGFRQLITDDRGVLVNYGDIESMSDALLSLINDPDRRNSMASNGKQYIDTYHSWDHVAVQTADLYSHLVGDKHRLGTYPRSNDDHKSI